MHNQSYVFAQLASHLDRNKFNYLARKYQGDSHIKVFSCWNQLKVLMFGQLSRRESLRDLMVAVKAHSGKAKFLGFGDSVTLSNLAKANQNRDYRIFEEYAYTWWNSLVICKIQRYSTLAERSMPSILQPSNSALRSSAGPSSGRRKAG